ncbi:hypothetical protein L249_3982 [Ophiocordyceps polyrhachis-furcata BCC 54312]|uniref:Uncharacterized protein n=1 Tax=Ophiocordyceps polyrhachis-furcata BCC 54312 TaxID=1330021 RepID=A0A367L5D4_9HYPO|nr:hypothetical protein L249_3982 [Ophiocordyceps polyrhachis-furcata BCC 54312]
MTKPTVVRDDLHVSRLRQHARYQSVLRYKNNDCSLQEYEWGWQALDSAEEDRQIHEWFKLGICSNFKDRVCRDAGLERKYRSPVDWLDYESDFGKKKLVTDFLTGVREKVDDYFRRHNRTASRLPKEYIITVPAIWLHDEQVKMQECAEKAGMGTGDRLQVVSEPEAAAIFAIEHMLRTGMQAGDTFIICDAGGGTVDLASCTIQAKEPAIQLAMTQTNLGALCGSSYLNRIFRSYLKRKLQGYGNYAEDDDFLALAVERFEKELKPEFSSRENKTHKIRVAGLKESRSHGIWENFIAFTTGELQREVFQEVMEKITFMVREQIKRTSGPIKTIVLVGGFGNNPELAVVRGALISGLNRRNRDGRFNIATRVVSRIAGRHYGTKAYVDFDPAIHSPDIREVNMFRIGGMTLTDDRHRRDDGDKVEVMSWFAYKVYKIVKLLSSALVKCETQGDLIPDGEPIYFDFEKTALVGKHIRCYADVEICVCEKTAAPRYPEHCELLAVEKIADLKLEFGGIPIPRQHFPQGEFHVARFEIEMRLESASLSFRGVYGRRSANPKWFDPVGVEWAEVTAHL